MISRLGRYFKKNISDIFYYLDKIKIRKCEKENSFRILLYHSIGDKTADDVLGIRVAKEEFLRQMQFLSDNKYNVMGLAELIELMRNGRPIPKDSVVITFDDGYRDNLTEAAPILKKFNYPALVFVCLDYLEGNKENSSGYWAKWDFLNKDELVRLADFNLDIGLHSLTHQHLSRLGAEELKREILDAKIKLEHYINRKVNLFSYPYGAFNLKTIEILRRGDFIGACCSRGGRNTFSADFYKLKRTEITADDVLGEFQKKLCGYYDAIEALRFS